MASDFYDALGVSRDAGQDEIQRAYRKLARQYHPDVNKDPGAEERFKTVSEAYHVLSDPAQRKRYDAFGEDFRRVPPDVDPDEYARSRRYAGAGARPGAGPGYGPGAGPGGFRYSTGGMGEDIDIEDLLGGIFGGRARRGWGPTPGADQEAEIELSVEEAFRGGHRTITMAGPQGGRTIEVTIPPGVTDGQRIRLAGQGGQGMDGGPPGDLYLVVHIAAHRRYRLEGRDLYVDLPLTPWEGALGASVTITTPGGDASVKVPKGTSSGRRLRLKGRGLPNPRGSPGDLYAEAKIMVPSKLTPEEERLFEQLAGTSKFDPRKRR